MTEQCLVENMWLVLSVSGSKKSSLSRACKQFWYSLFSSFLGMFISEDGLNNTHLIYQL